MIEIAVVVALLVPATVTCLAYLVPTLTGLWPRQPLSANVPHHTFAILIPAHDEEGSLPATLQSLAVLDYPPEMIRVYVVADNCSDRTAAIAREAGAVCLVRRDTEARGKGHALAFGLDWVLKTSPDAVLFLDADCTLNATALRAIDAAFARGAKAVQCAVRSRNADDGAGGYVAAVGAAVDEKIAAGLDRLGRSVPLRGTGMAFRRAVLETVAWAAFGAAEDAEYARQLRRANVRIQHCGAAIVSCDAPEKADDLYRQRRRWRAAGVLRSKPLVLAHLVVTDAVSLACEFVTWPLSLVLLTAAIYIRAMIAIGLNWHRVGLMLKSPSVVLRLAWLTLNGLVSTKPATWARTPRPVARERWVA